MDWRALVVVVGLTGCNMGTKTPVEQLAEVKNRDDCYLLYAATAKTNLAANIARGACDRKFGYDVIAAVDSVAGTPDPMEFNWVQTTSSEHYRSLTPEQQKMVKDKFFEFTVAARVPRSRRDIAYRYWIERTETIDAAMASRQPKHDFSNAVNPFQEKAPSHFDHSDEQADNKDAE